MSAGAMGERSFGRTCHQEGTSGVQPPETVSLGSAAARRILRYWRQKPRKPYLGLRIALPSFAMLRNRHKMEGTVTARCTGKAA